MKSIISLTFCVTAALLSTASPLGDRRVLARKHTGAPLARRFVLASRLDAPAACAALPPSGPGNATTFQNPLNVTDSGIPSIPDNSTVTAPIAGDNSTVVDTPVDTNATVIANATAIANATTPADNSTATVTRRYGSWNFDETWFDLCSNSGGDLSYLGGDPCFDYGIDGFSALCADADVCAQQAVADAMITFAKSEGVSNSADLIQVAVAYRRLPREAEEIFGFYPSTPYCHIASINTELNGIWNEQSEGVTVGLYGGPNYPIMPFGQDGSCPYGQFPDVTSCSCVSNFYSPTYSTVDATPTDIMMTDAPIPTDAPTTDSTMDDSDSTMDDSDSTMDDSDSTMDDSDSTMDDSNSTTDASVASTTTDATASTTSIDSAATPNFNIPDGR
ncbi:hypothetical protein C8R45DRAFT_617960 [Mycena sanguinolenta]|nr:hypothetical protein C8R45DRAFT_617960 [Mycena sanguinolenta]